MGDSRRPRRTKKEVSYSSFNHSDDDEDFASFTPPVSKKSKTEKNGKKQSEKSKSKDLKRKAPKDRKVVDDRIFDKEMQLALEMSMLESSSQSQEMQETSQNETEISRPAAEVSVEVHNPGLEEELPKTESTLESKTAETVVPVETEMKTTAKVNQESIILKADEIDFIETVEDDEEGSKSSAGRSRRKAAQRASSKQKALLVEDDDDNEDGESDADDDFKAEDDDLSDSDVGDVEDDEDEDFSFSPKKKKRKGSEGKPKKEAVSKTKKQPSKKQTKTPRGGNENKSPPTRMKKVSAGVRSNSKAFTPPTLTNNSATKSPSLPASRQIKRKPVVISPKDSNGNNPLGGVKLVSPGQPFRLGLSRFARVKPLHANPKVP